MRIHRVTSPCLAVVLALAAVLPACRPVSPGTDVRPSLDGVSAEEIVERMFAAYRDADEYEDQAFLRISYRRQGGLAHDDAPMSVVLARPNRLIVHGPRATVKCDGRYLHAQLHDPVTRDQDGQVVEREAPATMTPQYLFGEDELLARALTTQIGAPLQIGMLMDDRSRLDFLGAGAAVSRLDDTTWDGFACARVDVQTQDGLMKLWIDQQTLVLRRLEFPTEMFAEQLAGATDIQVAIDFKHARFNSGNADQTDFQLGLSPRAKRVRRFVPVPLPFPADVFRDPVQPFAWQTLDGQSLALASISGKTVVLLWFQNDPDSWACLGRLEAMFRKSEAEPRSDTTPSTTSSDTIQFVGVFVGNEGDEAIARAAARHEITMPIVNDHDEVGKRLAVMVTPTLVVLNGAGRVQMIQACDNPEAVDRVSQVIERIAGGEDLGRMALEAHERELREYQLRLAAVDADRPAEPELPMPTVAPRSEPERLTLRLDWSCDELKSPGNLLASEAADDATVWVVDGPRHVVQIDEQGRVARRVELPIPEPARVSYLRSIVDGKGRRHFLASAILAPQVFVFDEQWKLRLTYPPEHEVREGIHDARLCDLEGDGTVELAVGFFGVLGVHAVDLDGKQVWSNRKMVEVLSITPAVRDEGVPWGHLLVAGTKGSLLRLDQFGNHDPEIVIRGRSIQHLFSANPLGASAGPSISSSGPAPYCGISATASGLVAVGLNPELEEEWSVDLPGGAYTSELQFATSGILWKDSVGCWVIAAADGTIAIQSEDGELTDRFALGQALTGLTIVGHDNNRRLVIATARAVQAYQVQPRK